MPIQALPGAGNRAAFEGEVRTWSAEASLGEQQRIGLYLLAVVKYKIRRSLMGEPAEGDLRRIAARCFPGVSQVLTAHPMAVEDTLGAASGLPAIMRKLSPGGNVLLSAAITGSMLTKPADEWPERVNARSFHEFGIEDRWGNAAPAGTAPPPEAQFGQPRVLGDFLPGQ